MATAVMTSLPQFNGLRPQTAASVSPVKSLVTVQSKRRGQGALGARCDYIGSPTNLIMVNLSLLMQNNITANSRKPYLHESRHLHALKRARGLGGRFETKNEKQQKEVETSDESQPNTNLNCEKDDPYSSESASRKKWSIARHH